MMGACATFMTGCAVRPVAQACPTGTGSPMRVYELYFARAIEGRADLTDAEWVTFRNTVIIPNLPAGSTVLDGEGAWLNPQTHATSSEPTKVLVVAVPDTTRSATAIQRVRTAYVTTFHQISVGMTSQSSCGSFDPE
jgi:hypothetical protein